MNKYIFNILILMTILFSSCKKEKRIPSCINNKVNEFKNIISCNTGSNVKQYEFQSKLVYVFDPGTCGADMSSEVLDENCNVLGYLGGITGNTTIDGLDFSNANYKSTIWSR